MVDDDNVFHIKKEMMTRGIGGSRLHLDITDRFGKPQKDRLIRNINDLKNFGIRIDLDDFGRGDAPVALLSSINADELKIDQETIRRFRADQDAMTMVKSIISIAKSLGIKVIAEGVERQEDAEVLKELGCDYAQGFYFMRPTSLDEAMAFDRTESTQIAE